ncbi:hypothetical protein BDV95DRAFT_270420 [Massariosphaeria phaeospora]|uniref:Mid2 domain-containing protein n=1 Tax=Massariosphaeria phaeospora TaxID=100035 RepID=A0A7C8HZQ0_9PLEO|nr:hypothetical protein BDV95DRAFT_270420 [Massariosphaeria phaeospora]
MRLPLRYLPDCLIVDVVPAAVLCSALSPTSLSTLFRTYLDLRRQKTERLLPSDCNIALFGCRYRESFAPLHSSAPRSFNGGAATIMARVSTSTTAWLLRAAGVGLAIQGVVAQKCYYPNGKEAPEKPCSSAQGAACCPDKWQCLDNGLCHYEPDNLYGAYSCTDETWGAAGCPSNLCTYEMKRPGGESITQCSSHGDQWCCNADATNVDCCNEKPEPRPFFDLEDGEAYATVGGSIPSEAPNLASITGLATSGAGSAPSRTPAPSSSADAPRSSDVAGGASSTPPSIVSEAATRTGTPVTSFSTQLSSGSSGVETLVVTLVSTPTNIAPPPPPTSAEKKSNLPVIIGCAVGIPLALALAGILFFLFRKRRNQHPNPAKGPYPNGDTLDPNNTSPDFAGGAKLTKHGAPAKAYKSETHVPELAGQSLGPGRPVSTLKGRAELASGGGFQPGATPLAPHLVGVGGGNAALTSNPSSNPGGLHAHTPQSTPQSNSWGSAPPGYSPGMNHNAFAGGQHAPGSTELDGTPAMSQTGFAGGYTPVVGAGGARGAARVPTAEELDGTPAPAPQPQPQYIPYRPPPGHGAAELSAVTTPP